MNWDLTKLSLCEAHGHHAGKVCPLCDAADKVVASVAMPLPTISAPPVEQYDRTNWYRGPEKEIHEWLETELIRLGINYIHGRMDKESTIRKGWPDFSAIYTAPDGITRACFVELKSKNTAIHKDQVEVIAELRERKIPVLVTGDFAEAVAFIKNHLSYP